MGLGYETYEDKREFVQEGLTGTVRRYVTEKMSYPCYVIDTDGGQKIEKYKINILMKMFKTAEVYDEEEAKLVISIYIKAKEKIVRIGQITPKQVKPLLRLFEQDIANIVGYYDSDTELEQDLLYVLSE